MDEHSEGNSLGWVWILLIIGAAIYFLFFNNSQQSSQQPEQSNAERLQKCLDSADQAYTINWGVYCHAAGKKYIDINNDCLKSFSYQECIDICKENTGFTSEECTNAYWQSSKSNNCRLSADQKKSLDEQLKTDKDDCFRQYPSK